ncbi:MAG: hypothetical protein EOL87_10285 [Spartobacteria bacterium]|nr:hypothetical protein [Spartobacteria bacterium]
MVHRCTLISPAFTAPTADLVSKRDARSLDEFVEARTGVFIGTSQDMTISNLSITEERSKIVDYFNPYLREENLCRRSAENKCDEGDGRQNRRPRVAVA